MTNRYFGLFKGHFFWIIRTTVKFYNTFVISPISKLASSSVPDNNFLTNHKTALESTS